MDAYCIIMSFYGSLNYCENPDDGFIGLNCENMLSIPEHRSGWNYVKDLCVKHLHRPKGYYLVDFVESIWGWKKVADPSALKDVFFENQTYYVTRDRVKCYHGREYVCLPKDAVVVYWNGLEWVRSETVTAEDLEQASPFGLVEEPWVGIVHNPTQMPKWFDFVNSPQEIIKCVDFQTSLRYCRGLIVFSEYLKKELLKMGGWPCEIHVVFHPTEPCETKFRVPTSRFFGSCVFPGIHKRHKRRLVQVGYWLRRLSSIWETRVPEGWTKHWVNRAEHGFRCLESELFHEHLIRSIVQAKDTVQVHQLSDEEFDRFLCRSIMFIDLYDSSCNNTIIEAIVRHVPIVTRRLPATVEYLGSDYCLFFNHIDEIHDMLEDDERIHTAHMQLRSLARSGRFYGDHFVTSMKRLPFLNHTIHRPDYIIALSSGYYPPDMKNWAIGPFEYTTHDYDALCKVIENNFDGFTDPYHLYINEDGYVAHREYGVVFAQETSTPEKLVEFARNDYDRLIRLYTRRIDNFHNVMMSTQPRACVLYHSEYPRKLVDVLRTKYPRTPFKVITINLIDEDAHYLDQPTNMDHRDIAFYTIKRTADYRKIIQEHLSI